MRILRGWACWAGWQGASMRLAPMQCRAALQGASRRSTPGGGGPDYGAGIQLPPGRLPGRSGGARQAASQAACRPDRGQAARQAGGGPDRGAGTGTSRLSGCRLRHRHR